MQDPIGFAKDFLNFLKEYGLPGALVIIVLLLIQNPDRATRLNSLLLRPIFRFFRWGSKQYIASEVGHATSVYINKRLRKMLPSIPETKIRIKWVTSPHDPVLSRDGTLILRLQETNDQTRNILAATRTALPRVICPSLRSNIQQYACSAIDLTLLRVLAEQLGKHAQPVFHRYFLSPEIGDNNTAAALFQKLVQLDQAGIFVSILLEELNLLGETIFASGDTSDKTDSVVALVEYFLSLATREVGEKMGLEYLSSDFRIGILLLAISWKTNVEGLPPYVRRIEQKTKLGCDSIYIVAYANARDFLARIVEALRTNSHLSLSKRTQVMHPVPAVRTPSPFSEIALYRRNTLFNHATFQEAITQLGIVEGSLVEGKVMNVARDAALIEVDGLLGIVTRHEASWTTLSACSQVLASGSVRPFLVKAIDTNREQLLFSLRTPESNPWTRSEVPSPGDKIEVHALAFHEDALICRTDSGIEVVIPQAELSWFPLLPTEAEEFLGKHYHVLILERDDNTQSIKASIRHICSDPWPEIQQRLRPGTIMSAKVIRVTPEAVKVELPGGLNGIIPRSAMLKAGYEFTRFEETVVPGQGLEVVVTGVSLVKRRIRLDLKRNLPTGTRSI